MAAVIGELCCVIPCSFLANCCSKCCSRCERLCGYLFDACTCNLKWCAKPFSGCVSISVMFNIATFVLGIAFISSAVSNGCSSSVSILLYLSLPVTVLNILFSFYIFNAVNNLRNDQAFTTTSRVWDIFCYDVQLFSCLIVYLVSIIAYCAYSISLGYSCGQSAGRSLATIGFVLLGYLSIAVLIFLSYVAAEGLKKMSSNTSWWFIPCCWPCLCIGCLLRNGPEDQAMQSGQLQPSIQSQQQEWKSRPSQPQQQYIHQNYDYKPAESSSTPYAPLITQPYSPATSTLQPSAPYANYTGSEIYPYNPMSIVPGQLVVYNNDNDSLLNTNSFPSHINYQESQHKTNDQIDIVINNQESYIESKQNEPGQEEEKIINTDVLKKKVKEVSTSFLNWSTSKYQEYQQTKQRQ